MNRYFLRSCGCALLAAWLWTAALAAQDAPPAVPPLPPVIARYEQMLAASPAKGTAFDKVYQHFFEGEGVDALDARWRARAAAGGPNAPAFLLLGGLLAERRAKPAEARALYQQYTAAHPEDPRGWTTLGELETAEGRFGPSADALTHALASDARPPVPVSARPTLFRELARAQTRNFLGAAALGTWRKLAAEFPDDPSVLQEVGEAFQEGESYDEARTTFEKVRDLAQKNNDAFGRINAMLRLGQIEEARGHAKAAVGIYEGVVADAKTGSWLEREARARIEQLYRGQEDLPGLADYYKKWLDDHPKDVEVATRRAAVLVELNHKDQAIDLLREAVAWAPERQELQVELARRLGETNRPEEMAAAMEKLTAVAPEEKSYWQLLGDARWQTLDSGPAAATMPAGEKSRLKAQAIEAWTHLSPADGKDAVATGQLAELLGAHRLVDEALAQYARAAALAPDLPDIRERWAAYLAQIGRRDEARRVLDGIVSADPKNATAANYARLATGLDRLDDTQGALDATAKGLALEPHNFDLLAARWQEFSDRKEWDQAAALYPALLAAAPNTYFAEQVQTRHVSALQASGKLADTRKTLAARLGATPPLDANELSLLIRADLQTSDEGEAADEGKRALAEGHARFPQDAGLVRLEGEAAKRAHNPEGQVAALRRLIELQPGQKTDVLQEITRVWRDADRPDDALATARELVAASPANAASYLLEADLLLGGAHPDEGLARLREAVKLSDKPNDVRLRLARAETDLGHDADARQTLDEAFEAAADAHERLSLMKPLADAYQRENRLDELISRFQHLQQAEADGWRYALYLAEIYQQTLDFGAARRELSKALAARPKDGALLRQLVRLATEEQNNAEVARYQAQLAEVEPSDSNRFALVEALLENHQPVEGLNALRANLSAILKIPGAWDRLLPLLASNDLTTKAGELLTREIGGPDADVKARFTLALFQMVAGNFDQAKSALWSVFAQASPRVNAPSAPPPKPAAPNAGGLAMSIYTNVGIPEQRYYSAVQSRYLAQAFLQRGTQGLQGLRSFYNVAGSPSANAPSPTDTARDTALLYLAAIAVKENAAAPFLTELDRRLAERNSSREDRLVAYASVNAVDAELREIAAQVQTPEPDLDSFCLMRLVTLAQMNLSSNQPYSEITPLTDAQANAMEPLFDRLLTRRQVADATPDPIQFDGMRLQFLAGIGRKEAAGAIRQKLLAGVDEKSPSPLLQMAISVLMEGDLTASDRAQLKTLCHALAAAEAKAKANPASVAGQFRPSTYYYPVLPWQQNSHARNLPPADFAEVEADLLSLWYPATPPPTAGAALGNATTTRYRYPGSSARDDDFLPPTRFLDGNQVRILQQLPRYASESPEWLQAVGAKLDQQAKELPAPVRVYPRLVAVYLAAADADKTKAAAAAQALLAEMPDDNDLRLLTAVLLGRNGQHTEALALLNAITNARYGEAAVTVQELILVHAQAVKDTETARRAALKLVNLRLTPEERTALVADLRTLGINDKADQLARTAAPARAGSVSSRRTHSIFDYDTGNQISSLTAAKNTDGALALIRNVFAALPPAAGNSGNAEYVIQRATSSLQKLGKADEFAAGLEKALAKDPDSLSLNYQLAVLHQEDSNATTTEKRTPASHPTPVWVKLARSGEEIAGSYSVDGVKWNEIGRATVPLGPTPLAALAGASSQTAPRAPDVVVENVTLTPPPTDAPNHAGPALPAPWTETLLPVDAAKSAVPPSTWQEGVFTLHAVGWDLWGRSDDTRLIHRPLGEATEFVARMVSVEGAPGETKAGVMWRADLTGDSPYAAVLVLPGGALTFQHRDRADRATPYWRKVVALQPKETRYGRALAKHLAGRGQSGEAIALYDGLIATDPDEALGAFNDLESVYGTVRLPELADRLLAWKPAPPAQNVSRSEYSESLLTVARACVTEGQPEKAIALCRRGLELDQSMGDSPNVEVYTVLFNALVAQKRPDEARDALVACYLPPAENTGKSSGGTGSGTGPQLGFRSAAASRGVSYNSWINSVSWGSSDVTLYQLGPLEAAKAAGLLEGLQTALEQRRGGDAKNFTDLALDWLLALVQIERQDPGVLDGLPALLAKGPPAGSPYSYNDLSQIAIRLEIGRRLVKWPGHEALAMEAFRAARRLAAANGRQNGPADLIETIGIRQARLEMELGDLPAATATLREVVAGFKPAGASSQQGGGNALIPCLGLLLQAGPEADPLYVDLFGKARGKNGLYFAYDLEKSQRTSDNPHYQAMAWLLDDGGDTPDATLVYELRVQHPYDKGGLGRYPGSRGRSFPGSEGERTLTFAYGRDSNHFETIGQLKTASTFGTWTGPVPPGIGVLQVNIDTPRAADAPALAAEESAKAAKAAQVTPTTTATPASPTPTPAPTAAPGPNHVPGIYWLRVVRAPNLLINPGFAGVENRDSKAPKFSIQGWTDLPAGLWKQSTFEGPRPGRPYTQVETGDEHTLRGARVPVEAGHSYFQSAWLRDWGEAGSVHFGRRYLDAEGNVLKTSEEPEFSTLIWRWHAQRLQTEKTERDSDAIPPRTAFIEPFLRFQGAVEWTGLFVGQAD